MYLLRAFLIWRRRRIFGDPPAAHLSLRINGRVLLALRRADPLGEH